MPRIYPTLSPNDIVLLEKKAKAEGLSVSNYVRKIIREDLRSKDEFKPTEWEVDKHRELISSLRALVLALVNGLALTSPNEPTSEQIEMMRKQILERWEKDRNG